jgi:Alpha/beta hydrolase family
MSVRLPPQIRHRLNPPLSVSAQGSFAFGGRQRSGSGRGEHGYVQYQIPLHARGLPILLWHGGTTSGSCWESTPDGRAGFMTLLVSRGFACYAIDQPRKGRAGSPLDHSAHRTDPSLANDDARSWSVWRLGVWERGGSPTPFPNLQLPTDEATIDQFHRRRTPDSGPADPEVVLEAVSALLEDLGPTVLIVHSNSGQYAWQLPSDNVAAIIAYEPGAFAFPVEDLPPEIGTELPEVARITSPIPLPPLQFQRLVRTPIQVVYGDNFTDAPNSNFGVELWRVNRQRAAQFVTALIERNADVSLLELPRRGITGNTHFPFSDLNNADIARLAEEFLTERNLASS